MAAILKVWRRIKMRMYLKNNVELAKFLPSPLPHNNKKNKTTNDVGSVPDPKIENKNCSKLESGVCWLDCSSESLSVTCESSHPPSQYWSVTDSPLPSTKILSRRNGLLGRVQGWWKTGATGTDRPHISGLQRYQIVCDMFSWFH